MPTIYSYKVGQWRREKDEEIASLQLHLERLEGKLINITHHKENTMDKKTEECDKCYQLKQEIIALQEMMLKMQDKHISFLKSTLDKIDVIGKLKEENKAN